ncbi:lipocalin family protein [Gelidibacter sp.]|uniref:lipocalin family protein n=1 Tax=Gelidibacter sp. TaxID=2018083 RepID=UPI002BB34135|nr:lipocalin family protein [Gelidibacter sp.]HUH26645.1 lipocalin family protein [Gelidibacter sp.]
MSLRYFKIMLIGFSLFLSCSNDDDGPDSQSDFYAGAKTSATENQLFGTWAIFNVGFNDQTNAVPISYPDCGRDFLVFSDKGIYTEYLFQSSDCHYEANTLSWTLKNGVIKMSNQYNQTEDLVITQVSANELIFKSRLDVTGDGTLDIVVLYLQRHTPIAFDMVSGSFMRNTSEVAQNLISYIWQPYHDAKTFVGYEIYRSAGDNCSKDEAVLIKTISDINITEFTDFTPPGAERLCYYLKTILRTGTLGESELQVFDSHYLTVKPVNLTEPTVHNNTIALNWEASDTPYFSHYEISYTNFPSGISGYGQQVVRVARISNKSTTSFIDNNPPFLKNPIYSIRVYDVFGNHTVVNPQGYKTAWQVSYERAGLLPIHRLFSYAIDPTEPVVYLYGYDTEASNNLKILRYNYETNRTETISSQEASTSTDLSIEIITSSDGKELVLDQGNELQIYDATTLTFKYKLRPSEISNLNDFRYASAGYWILTDGNYIYSYVRNEADFTLVDSKPHFSNHQGFYKYSVFEIENNQLLLGHKNESSSMVYAIDNNGMLSYLKTVALPIKESGMRQSEYNAAGHYMINFEDKSLYSTLNYSSLGSFQQPYFATGISTNGSKIYGSNNDPNWSIDDTGAQTKEAVVFNRGISQVQTLTTNGYPQVIFQNYKGDVLSISSGLKKSRLREGISYTMDLFIEKLEVQ